MELIKIEVIFSIYLLRRLVWFIQRGGENVPDDLWGCDGMSEGVRSLPNDGLQLTQIMDLCWSQPVVRPSAVILHNIYKSCWRISEYTSETDLLHEPKEDLNASHRRSNGWDGGWFFPRNCFEGPSRCSEVSKDPQLDYRDRELLLRSSSFTFGLEQTFLRPIKPIHQILCVTWL